jgi:hypothetical protein
MKRIIIAAFALLIGLSGCDNLLDLQPLSQISQTDYFKTETDLQLFSNTFYNNLLDKSPYDVQSDLYIQQNLCWAGTIARFRLPEAVGRGPICVK